jgi:hypothetical protein
MMSGVFVVSYKYKKKFGKYARRRRFPRRRAVGGSDAMRFAAKKRPSAAWIPL